MGETEFNKLSKNISEFGLVDPLIINLKNNRIVGGHQRYDVLLEMGVEELLVLKRGDIGLAFLDEDLKIKSEDHEKALNLALNKISGEWDETKLAPLLEDFQFKDFDVELTGFDNLETDDFDIGSFDFSEDDDTGYGEEYENNMKSEPTNHTQYSTIESEETHDNIVDDDELYEEIDYEIPEDEPEYDESIADEIETITCPRCGYELPKH